MGELEGRVAIITGGASGIGAATTRLFVENGARVVVADLQRELGNALAAELAPNVIFERTDVSTNRTSRPRCRAPRRRSGDSIACSTTRGSVAP